MSAVDIPRSDLAAAARSLVELLRTADRPGAARANPPAARHRRRGIGRREDDLPDWRESAACVAEDLDLFFPVSATGTVARRQVGEAKAVCERCPVRAACLDWALRVGPEFGIFGGATAEERRVLREDRAGLRPGGRAVLAHRTEQEVLEALEPH